MLSHHRACSHLLSMDMPSTAECKDTTGTQTGCGKGSYLADLDDLNSRSPDAVASTHFLVELRDSTVDGEVAELLVSVVCAGARVKAEPHAEVLYLARVALMHLGAGHDLASSLVETVQLGHEVPEAGARGVCIGSEHTHAVDLRGRLLLGRVTATRHEELLVKRLPNCPKHGNMKDEVLLPT